MLTIKRQRLCADDTTIESFIIIGNVLLSLSTRPPTSVSLCQVFLLSPDNESPMFINVAEKLSAHHLSRCKREKNENKIKTVLRSFL